MCYLLLNQFRLFLCVWYLLVDILDVVMKRKVCGVGHITLTASENEKHIFNIGIFKL